jgi:hypothetical protein
LQPCSRCSAAPLHGSRADGREQAPAGRALRRSRPAQARPGLAVTQPSGRVRAPCRASACERHARSPLHCTVLASCRRAEQRAAVVACRPSLNCAAPQPRRGRRLGGGMRAAAVQLVQLVGAAAALQGAGAGPLAGLQGQVHRALQRSWGSAGAALGGCCAVRLPRCAVLVVPDRAKGQRKYKRRAARRALQAGPEASHLHAALLKSPCTPAARLATCSAARPGSWAAPRRRRIRANRTRAPARPSTLAAAAAPKAGSQPRQRQATHRDL